MSRWFKLTVAYDGTDFAGWQVQPRQSTIQSALQSAIYDLTGESVAVIGSGRTDSGVHALAQVASCQIQGWRDGAAALARALNAKLPDTIVVTAAADAADGFHAIRDAVKKMYRYQLQLGGVRDAFDYRYRWQLHGKIDVAAMCEAATKVVGHHDCACFQAAGGEVKTTVRRIHRCEIVEQGMTVSGARRCAVEIEADGFLYNMVRNIVGTLVEVGRGRHTPAWIDELIAARNRELAGPTAPPHGLFLVRVDYE